MRNSLGDRPKADRLEESPLAPRALRQANVESPSLSRPETVYHGVKIAGYSECAGDVIGRADRQDGNRGCAVTQGTSDPCHRAVAARHDHEVPVLGQGFPIVSVLARLIVRREAGSV